jgi:fucose permease
VITVFFPVVIDMIGKSFFFPTFTNYLTTNFDISIEGSSVFFVVNMATYLLMLQFLNSITQRLGLKLTLTLGMGLIFIGVLFLPPIDILPK